MQSATRFFVRAPSIFPFFLVLISGFHAVGICQSQGDGKPPLKLTLSEKYFGEMQILDVESLQPGTSNSILFDIVNELPEKVDLEEIRLSCGCMSAIPAGKVIEPKQSIQLKIDLRLDPFDTKVNRKFRIIADKSRAWDVGLVCSPEKVFRRSDYLVDLGQDKKEVELDLEFETESKYKSIPAKDWVCTSTNSIIRSAGLVDAYDANGEIRGLKITAKVDPGRFGIQKDVVDRIELSSTGSKIGISVRFRNNRAVRVMPDRFTKIGISTGTHSVMVFHDKELLTTSFKWLATHEDGSQNEVAVLEEKKLQKATIITLQLTPKTQKIDLLSEGNSLATIQVVEN